MDEKKIVSSGNDIAAELYEKGNTTQLILRFAAPAVFSLLINSLYNIVDQIFIGHGVGVDGIAAVNVSFPVATFTVAAAALIGDGAAAALGLNLGRGQKERGQQCAATALLLGLMTGFFVLAAGLLFTEPLLSFFGTTDQLMEMASSYMRITLWGIPAVLMSTVLAGLIRMDGRPGYAMVCMLTGCVINLVFDPLFIFVFHWGIKGAALATILGQFANLCLALCYLPRFQTIVFRLGRSFLSLHSASEILRYGIAGFVNQFAGTVYMVVVNQTLSQYGAASVYGSEIPLAVFGIVMKMNQVSMSFLNGIAVGMQPILSFNYGRKNYQRVRECLTSAVVLATSCGCVLFLIFELLPAQLVGLFGSSDPLYMEFGVYCVRIFLIAAPLYGFNIVSTGLFQAIGKPVHSMFMALSRQIIYLVPLVYLMAPIFGIIGFLFSAPIADLCAFITCMILYRKELKHLKSAA